MDKPKIEQIEVHNKIDFINNHKIVEITVDKRPKEFAKTRILNSKENHK